MVSDTRWFSRGGNSPLGWRWRAGLAGRTHLEHAERAVPQLTKDENGTEHAYTSDQSGSQPLVIQIGALNVIYGPDGMPLEQYSFGTAAYYLHDWDGSTLGLVSGSGSIVASYSYDSYGNLTSSSGSESTPLRFQGQYQDPETGGATLLTNCSP